MTIINRSALLPYDAHQLFSLVCDIESYPRYMDGCVGASVLHRDADVIEARLDLARAGIKQSFSTRNRMVSTREITLELKTRSKRPGMRESPRPHFSTVNPRR